jgi:AcrR family transcriptional regulator
MSYITERREEERERRRLEIIEAAEQLYAEKGWDAVTMDRVARIARLSRALLYVYFRDKEDLLFAITSRALEELRQRFEQAAAAHRLGIDQVTAITRTRPMPDNPTSWPAPPPATRSWPSWLRRSSAALPIARYGPTSATR